MLKLVCQDFKTTIWQNPITLIFIFYKTIVFFTFCLISSKRAKIQKAEADWRKMEIIIGILVILLIVGGILIWSLINSGDNSGWRM